MRLFSTSTKPGPNGPEVAKPQPNRFEALSKVLDRNGRWIEVADAKAGVVLVFTTAVLRELVGPSIRALRTLATALSSPVSMPTIVLFCLFVSTLLVVTITALRAVFHAFGVLNPKLTRGRQPGHIFFGDIAQQDFAKYQQQMATIQSEDLEEEVIEQIHTTACIARVKHEHVGRAVRSVFLIIPFGLLLYVLSLYVS